MSRSGRIARYGLALLAVLLVGLGVWLYVALYVSTDAAIYRAEAFRFRRMHVARLAEQGTYRFFYATNRELGEARGPLEERFGNRRADALAFGRFDTAIEPSLGLGMIINPTEWFQNEEIQLREVLGLDRAAFVEQLRDLVLDSPHRSLLVVVHGFREAFPSALRKTAFVGHVLDIDSPVLLFDWPGNQGSSLRGYRRAREVAEASGTDLARALALIVDEIAPQKLWLLANSMGAQVAADAFDVLHREADWADRETEIEDVVLTAPDVGQDVFDSHFAPKISALARDLTVYVSSNDRALVMSRVVNRERRRGESTLSPDQLDEAIRVSELIDPDSERIALVDVTPVNRTRNFHNFSLETPEFFDDLYLRLVNADTPQSRLLYRLQTPEGATYWVLTRGR
jgi:esterase/lipase superfamily enzyme